MMSSGRVVLALAVALSMLSGCSDEPWPSLASVPGTPPDSVTQEEFGDMVDELLKVRDTVAEQLESWPHPESGN